MNPHNLLDIDRIKQQHDMGAYKGHIKDGFAMPGICSILLSMLIERNMPSMTAKKYYCSRGKPCAARNGKPSSS